MKTKAINFVLEDQSASFWLKRAVVALMDRDAVDATIDAEYLAKIMRERLEIIQGRKIS